MDRVGQAEEAGLVVVPAVLEVAVDRAFLERYGVPAEGDAGGAGLLVVGHRSRTRPGW
ncbi:hypothetical protein JOF29_004030 [Kribbella aluminosa]|uniref:Uncharacterized protein n=1 Tax=Kribbella aluminosa TaxID=416017 RepID=A0ABS4UMR8_9ACTN|nr:hypothetical protein [Kribbella aluminosa]MBP2352947.1 hypothetical protein [Kribbella aluminosa]